MWPWLLLKRCAMIDLLSLGPYWVRWRQSQVYELAEPRSSGASR